MEKIYMDENKGKKQKRNILNTSVILSFVVSLFAVFSLAMFGIVTNQKTDVSYAVLPDNTNEFTFRTATFNQGGIQRDEFIYVNGYEGDDDYKVPMYYASTDDSQQIFCVEHKADVSSNPITYEADSNIEDYGLLYLLNSSFASGKKVVTDASDTASKYVETWVAQTAIWLYLNEKNPTDTKHTISEQEKTAIENAKSLKLASNGGEIIYTVTGENNPTIYSKYIRPLVDAAKNANNVKKITITKEDDKISVSKEDKYYQSAKMTVTGEPSSDLQNYDVILSGIDDAYIVDLNGQKLSLTGIAPGTEFYVRIPSDKVTEKVQNLNVKVTGHFSSFAGRYYVAEEGNLQKVVSVTNATIKSSADINVEFVGTPDTGMNTAQTIYFIGLIVLLCGVGIVYANAKPVQAK